MRPGQYFSSDFSSFVRTQDFTDTRGKREDTNSFQNSKPKHESSNLYERQKNKKFHENLMTRILNELFEKDSSAIEKEVKLNPEQREEIINNFI